MPVCERDICMLALREILDRSVCRMVNLHVWHVLTFLLPPVQLSQLPLWLLLLLLFPSPLWHPSAKYYGHYYHCDQCNTKCTTTKDLIALFVTAHQEDLSTCNTCGLVTANTDVLQKHIRTSHVSQHLPEATPRNTEEILKALKNEITEEIKDQLKTHLEEITQRIEIFKQNVNHKNTKNNANKQLGKYNHIFAC